MTSKDREAEVEAMLTAEAHALFDDDAMSGTMSETNAFGWSVDELEVMNIDLQEDECAASFTFTASGDQDPDRMWSGDTITGEGTAVIDAAGNVTFQVTEANVVRDEAPESD
jgi:hypothetical protein